MNIGYKDDVISLISSDGCEQYRINIPPLTCWWWLISADGEAEQCITEIGNQDIIMNIVTDEFGAVRPILNYSKLKSEIIKSSISDNHFYFNNHTFRIIDTEKEIAIAETPIAFDYFDENDNKYENSAIRHKLLNWLNTGNWDYYLH